MTQGWLIIERIDNWHIDSANNFSFFGLKSRYRKLAAGVKEKDLIFCYVSSGLSSFADIRVVQEAGLKPLKDQSYWDAFPLFFSTAPVLVMPREKWVPLKEIGPSLDLTKGRTDYRPLFQTSIRKLTPHDTAFLESRIRNAL